MKLKRLLFIICAIPCVLNAQETTKMELKKNPWRQWLKNQLTSSQTMLRAGTSNNLPDSIYTYEGANKKLVKIESFTYDTDGRIQEIISNEDKNKDGKINPNEGLAKVVYTYTQTGETIYEERIASDFENNQWEFDYKIINVTTTSNIWLEYMIYEFEDNQWELFSKTVAAEFNEKGWPVVYRDTTFENIVFPMRIELSYNEEGNPLLLTSFAPDSLGVTEDKWSSYEKIVFTYSENQKLIKEESFEYEDGKWELSYQVDYTYDDKGNLASEIETISNGEVVKLYFTNIYSTVTGLNPLQVEATIYPNPVSDVLYVKMEDVQNAELILVNAAGSLVSRQKTDQQQTTVPVSHLAKGNYILIIQTNLGSQAHKICIQ